MNATLLLGEGNGGRGVLVARTIRTIRTIRAIAAVPSIAIAASPVAPPAAMLLALALRPWALTVNLGLAFGRKLMELGSLAARHRWLRRTRLLLSLLRWTLLAWTAVGPIGARSTLISPVGTSILTLALTIALLLAVAAAALLEPPVLLAVAAAAVAAIPALVAPAIATPAITTLLLVAPMIALLRRL